MAHAMLCLPRGSSLKCFKNNLAIAIKMMETISVDSSDPKIIKEGKAEILIPESSGVFYNPVQEFNRDISVAVLRVIAKEHEKKLEAENNSNGESKLGGLKILEAFSATGLRSIRYAKEVPGIEKIIANDISEGAVKNIEANIKHNKVENIVETSLSDAAAIMFNSKKSNFNVIDLDPYGCPSQFLDSAVQSVFHGGVLMVTCTDMAVLCGNTPSSCYAKYGALSLKIKSCHEMALRIVLQTIESHANRYKRYIVPLLSISADFYVRVFVQVFLSASVCKRSSSKLSMVFMCTGCDSFALQPLGYVKQDDKHVKFGLPHSPPVETNCRHCGGMHQMGGPIWTAPLHNESFVTKLMQEIEESDLATKKRLLGIVTMIREELHDIPLYHVLDKLCSTVNATTIPMMTLRSAILNGGFRVSFSHARRGSVKSDAPMTFIWDVIREWVKLNPINENKLIPGQPNHTILNTPVQHTVDFSLRPDANPLSREMRLVRFQENPTKFWGPGTKSCSNANQLTKSERNQNKRKMKRLNNKSEEVPLKTSKCEDEAHDNT